MTQLDLDRYLDRIGFTGDRDPTPQTLDRIVAHHTEAIPFENLDPFLGVPNRLDLESLQRKLVDGGRGGYCFEHNLLLQEVLRRLGFEVSGLSARVRWGAADDEITPRSHMLLRVSAGGEQRIADVGFGGLVVPASLALTPDIVQPTPLEDYRLTPHDDEYTLEARLGDTWRALYRFDLQRQLPIDYEAPNWFVSTSPRSKFVTSLIASRVTPDRRFALGGRRLTTHAPGTASEQRVLESPGALRAALEEVFRIDTAALDIDEAFAKAAS